MPQAARRRRAAPTYQSTATHSAILKQPVNDEPINRRILWGTPTLGVIRMEWANAVQGLIMPCNWSNGRVVPYNYMVADAQNLIAHEVLTGKWEWCWLLEDDNIVPANTLLLLEEHMRTGTVPIVSGLYHLKNSREPLLYRGSGTGAYWPGPKTWKPGDQVWVDGVPTGCLLVHRSIFEVMAKDAEVYELRNQGQTVQIKRIFTTPRDYWIDPATGSYQMRVGTSDLYWCRQIIRDKVLARAGWPRLAKQTYPFLVDTRLAVGHIDRTTGQVW